MEVSGAVGVGWEETLAELSGETQGREGGLHAASSA